MLPVCLACYVCNYSLSASWCLRPYDKTDLVVIFLVAVHQLTAFKWVFVVMTTLPSARGAWHSELISVPDFLWWMCYRQCWILNSSSENWWDYFAGYVCTMNVNVFTVTLLKWAPRTSDCCSQCGKDKKVSRWLPLLCTQMLISV